MKNSSIQEATRSLVILPFSILLIISIVSIVVLGPFFSSTGIYKPLMQSIDQRKDKVLLLVSASSIASAGISAIPDDTCTPIADKLADCSTSLSIVLAVLFAEKYLMPLFGGITFFLLIPIGCILLALFILRQNRNWMKQVGIKLLILGIGIFAIVPVSVFVSDTIENTFHESIDDTINGALSIEDQMEEASAEGKTFWDNLSDTFNNVIHGVTNVVEYAKKVLSRFIEAVAITFITCCVIPLIVVFILFWTVKQLFKADYDKITLQLNRNVRKKESYVIGS